jgi:hypothetical protein
MAKKKKENQIKIDYCASGFLGYSGAEAIIRYALENGKDEYIDYIVAVMHYLRDQFNKVGIHMSVMFNAQYEQKNAYMIDILRQHGFDMEVHADSGGLQVMTRGLDLEKEKPGIFECQGKYADLAMSFDEMPNIKVNEEKNKSFHFGPKKIENMYFVKELAFIKGEKSSKNIVDQIEEFIKQGTKARIIVILQGHTIEDYNNYARGVYSLIPEKYYKYIHGISLGGTGFQSFDDLVDVYLRIQRDLTAVPKDHLKQIHILGTGTLERIFPFLILANKDYYDFPFTFSFDATTHASASTWGKWSELKDNGGITVHTVGGYKMNKLILKHTTHMYEELAEYLKIVGINSYDEMLEQMTPYNSTGKRLSADFGADKEGYLKVANFYSFNTFILESSTYLKLMDKIVNGNLYDASTKNKYRKIAGSLISELKSYEDYISKEKEIRKVLKHLRPRKINYVNTLKEIEHLMTGEIPKHEWDEWE